MILKYLNFLFSSTNQHGVHSPFIFDLVTKCFYKKNTNINSFFRIKQQLLDNKTFIKVTDFGSGSKIFNSENRKVSKIAKVAGISNIKAKLLIKIVSYFNPNNILEIGTSLGLGTSAIKIGNYKSNIITLEGCQETSKIAENLFKENNFKSIKIINGNFNKIIENSVKNNSYDFIYFDGNHTKKASLEYFETCLPSINNNTFWIFDDIYWSKDMQEAWLEIKKHPKVTVTVDVFHCGIVFFREEQAKEHFKIRI